jgi:serine protease
VITLAVAGLSPVAAHAATTPAVSVPRPRVPFPTRPAIGKRRIAGGFVAMSAPQLTYHGGNDGIGVMTGPPKVYLVFWGSQWGSTSTTGNGDTALSGDPQNIAPRLQDFFKGVGTNNEQWSGVVTQYCEGVSFGATSCPAGAVHVGYPTGGAYAGLWADTSASAPSNATAGQIGGEAVSAAAHFHNLTGSSNRNVVYVVVSPTGTHPDGFNAGANFCAWHDYVPSNQSPYGSLAFMNLPYIPDMGMSCGANYVNAGASGALDGVTIVGGHEYDETLTDQTLGAWWDSSGNENADKCAWNGVGGTGGAQDVTFATGSFPIQATWSNDSMDCRALHAVVGAPGDFSISATSAALRQGGSASSTIRTVVTKGSSLAVTLTTGTMPSGVTASFDSNAIASGSSAVLTFTAGANVVPGRYAVTVTGTATSAGKPVIHSASVSLTVALGNDFALSSASVSGRQGGQPSVALATRTVVGSPQNIALSMSVLPAGVTASFSSNPVATGTSSTLSFVVGANVVPGRYVVTITGTGVSGVTAIVHSAPVTLTVALGNDFALSSASVSGRQGGQPSVALATRTVVGDPQDVTLSMSALPAGLTASFSANPVTTGTASTVSFVVGANVVPGRYSVTVTGHGVSGGAPVVHSAIVVLTVGAANDFSVAGASVSARQGAQPSVPLATHTVVGDPQDVTLSMSALPAGLTASFSSNPVTTGMSSTVSFVIGANVRPGRYVITITGTGVSGGATVVHSASVSLVVVSASLPSRDRII